MSLVAEPSRTSRSPLANGSRVPACPARAPVRSRSRLTAANDDGPSGLSTSTSPVGLSARGSTLGYELGAQEGGDVLDRLVAREARGATVAPAAPFAGDRGHVQLVARRAQADPSRSGGRLRRLANR